MRGATHRAGGLAAPSPWLAALLIAPADRLRGRLLRSIAPLAKPFIRDRDLRVAAALSGFVCTALAATLLAPLWVLALGPIVWGIPHLLGDVRHLIVRSGYHTRPGLLFAAAPVVATGLGASVLLGFWGAAAAVVVARASPLRKLVGLALVGALALALRATGGAADVVFAHAHNFIAVALWWAWRPRAGRWHWLALALYAGACLLLLSDLALAVIFRLDALALGPDALGLSYQLARLSPGVPAALAVRLLLVFTFAQAIHYGVWLKLVPDDDRARATPPTFAASYRALRSDLGPVAVGVTAALCVGLAIWAVFDLAAASDGYFRMARFHGHLELSAAAVLLMEGRPRRR